MNLNETTASAQAEFDPIKDFQTDIMGGRPMSPELLRKLKRVFTEAFDRDYIDFMQTADMEITLLFESTYGEADRINPTAAQYTIDDIPHIWADCRLSKTLH